MNPSQDPKAMLRTAQFLIGALAAGLLSFTLVTVFLVLSGNGPATTSPTPSSTVSILLITLGVLTLSCTAASFVIATLTVATLRKQADAYDLDEDSIPQRFTGTTIIRGALAEGPGLFGTVIVLISGNWLGFAGTAWGLLMLVLIVFPTRDRLDGFFRDITGRSPEV